MNALTLEQQLLEALQNIVYEVMDYPPTRPYSADSYLPAHLIAAAQAAIKNYHDDAAALDIDLEELNLDLELDLEKLNFELEKQGVTQ
ncbi:MAG: hypothetical protein WAO71_12540 [Gallionella sp.]